MNELKQIMYEIREARQGSKRDMKNCLDKVYSYLSKQEYIELKYKQMPKKLGRLPLKREMK